MKPARVSHTSCQPEMEGSGEKGLASLIHSVFWVDRAPPQWLWGTSRDGEVPWRAFWSPLPIPGLVALPGLFCGRERKLKGGRRWWNIAAGPIFKMGPRCCCLEGRADSGDGSSLHMPSTVPSACCRSSQFLLTSSPQRVAAGVSRVSEGRKCGVGRSNH